MKFYIHEPEVTHQITFFKEVLRKGRGVGGGEYIYSDEQACLESASGANFWQATIQYAFGGYVILEQ